MSNHPLPSQSKVIVGLSGGVDSSLSAWLLKSAGYEVEGLFMFNWDEQDSAYCTAADDFKDAQKVCDRLDIPLHQVNFAEAYRNQVFNYFLEVYQAGRTPNPDVLCNREIKFGCFYDHAKRLGANAIATGHYARLVQSQEQTQLHQALDQNKDQSYFLHAVDEAAFAHTLFPLGELDKPAVRKLALEQGLHVHQKRDSTGICFVGERPFREFLGRYVPAQPGEIRSLDHDRCVGEHQGLMFFTLGQREGLGIGGQSFAEEKPWYVVHKALDSKTLWVSQRRDHPDLMSERMQVKTMHWINSAPAHDTLSCQVKTRYRQQAVACSLTQTSDSTLDIHFKEPQWAVTPGQYAVFYDGSHCLGGGEIDRIN